LVSAWGSTETGPLAASCHFAAPRAGVIGLPVPGTELKLTVRGPKLEAGIRGPQVTPGYWKDEALTARSFDEEGFYQIGDALRFVDEHQPQLGLYFDGRVSEDFKLMTGTWVNAGALRIKALAALAPLIQDVVVAGHDREEIGFLLFPNFMECQRLSARPSSEPQALVGDALVRRRIADGLAELRRHATGSSTFAARALLMIEAPSIDAGEITDKGYINQGVVLSRRADLVAQLFSKIGRAEIILPSTDTANPEGKTSDE
jgi:feruloyl-CoA synthase